MDDILKAVAIYIMMYEMNNFSVFSDVIDIKYEKKEIGVPAFSIYSRPHFKINEDDFFLDIKNIARYRVQNGQQVSICPYEDADEESVNLFLEGSVLGALLHQRGIIPFHGSSFSYKDRGIIICGHSGAGKSSVTAAFCQEGATFINDDITPVTVAGSKTTILPVKTRIKLWDDALQKLKIEAGNLQRIRPGMDKFYLPMEKKTDSEHNLSHIFILSTHNKNEYRATEPEGMGKYNALRKQIYRRIYLKGMPETEKKYFGKMFLLANKVKVTYILRPQICDIQETMRFIGNEIES